MDKMNVDQILALDRSARLLAEAKSQYVKEQFSDLLGTECDARILPSLYKFLTEPPWTYWDLDLACKVRDFLMTAQRSVSAFSDTSNYLDLGFRSTLDQSWLDVPEDVIAFDVAEDVKKFSTTILPAYLRLAEYGYTNLMRFLYSCTSTKNYKYGTASHSDLVKILGAEIERGYNKTLRNGVAHGNVRFGLHEITYGNEGKFETKDVIEIMQTFDNLWSTNLSIALGIFLFLAARSGDIQLLPASLLAFILGNLSERPGLKLQSAIVHDANRGREMLLYVDSINLSREQFFSTSILIAIRAFFQCGLNFESILLSFNSSDPPSVLRVMREPLRSRLESSSVIDTDVLDLDLIWSPRPEFLAVPMIIIQNLMAQSRAQEMRGSGLRVKRVENVSLGLEVRVRVTAVAELKYANSSPAELIELLIDLAHKSEKCLFKSAYKSTGGIQIPMRPTYVWVDLYRSDQNMRQIGGGGWYGQNLLLQAELRKPLTAAILKGPNMLRVRGVNIFFRDSDAEAIMTGMNA